MSWLYFLLIFIQYNIQILLTLDRYIYQWISSPSIRSLASNHYNNWKNILRGILKILIYHFWWIRVIVRYFILVLLKMIYKGWKFLLNILNNLRKLIMGFPALWDPVLLTNWEHGWTLLTRKAMSHYYMQGCMETYKWFNFWKNVERTCSTGQQKTKISSSCAWSIIE